MGDGFAYFGDVAEAHEDETGQGFYASFAGQVPLHLSFEVAEVEAAVHEHCAAGGGEDGEGGGVELVFQFAGKLLDGVLGGDQSDRGAVLVDHDGDLAAALLEVAEEIGDGFGFGNDEDVAHDVAEGEVGVGSLNRVKVLRFPGPQMRGISTPRTKTCPWGPRTWGTHHLFGGAGEHEAGEVFRVDDADDVLGAAGFVVNGDAGAHVLDDLGGGRFDGQVGGQGKDLLAGGHDLADGHVFELEDAVDEGLLELGQNAEATGGGGDELELLRRVDLGTLGEGNVETAEDEGGRILEEADGGAGQGHEEEHGRGDGDGQSLGAAQGERFGDEFAYHYVEVGDEGKAEGDGGDGSYVGINLSVSRGDGQHAHPAQEGGGGQRLADPAEGQGAEGDAELDGGKKVVQVALQAADGACARDGGREHLLDACVADGDQGELGGHKEGIGQNEQADGDELEQGKTGHPGVRIALLQRSGVRDQRTGTRE